MELNVRDRKLLYLCILAVLLIPLEANLAEDDAVTIEAEPAEKIKAINRRGKQVYYGPVSPYQPYSPVFVSTGLQNVPLATAGPCITSKGMLGKCTPFRQCYPYFKVPELSQWENWILGMYDTCSYYTVQGRQVFGVCCTNEQPGDQSPENQTIAIAPAEEEKPESSTNTNEQPKYPNYPNWPPPIPTHPPDHAAPTHPASPGIPPTSKPTAWPPSAWPPTQKPPSQWPPTQWPPTQKPPVSLPASPSQPPSKPTKVPPVTTTAGVHTCGAKNGFQDQERIVGGHNADVGEWPWIAALFNNGRQFCGGSLIDNIHILSAAHCVAHMSSWDVARLTVRLADHNIKTNTEIRHVEKRVKRVVRHRGFDPRTLYNDIAILTLDGPVHFSQLIRPICLPSSVQDFAGHTGTVIGWGSLRESGPQPAVLQEVSVPIWSNRDCRLKYGPAAPGGIVEHMICAGQAARDSCSGDSGGPLMINNGRWIQVGIVSWGIGCGKGQYPGVYTRVEKFLPWINKNLK